MSLAIALLAGCAVREVPVEKTVLPVGTEAAVKEPWRVEWEKTLKEARKEGKVIIYGPAAPIYRNALVAAFQKAYPYITVEYTGTRGTEHATKIQAERRGGIFRVDMYIGGTTSILTTAVRDFAVPVEPYLILPEVKDGKYWRDGKLHFADSEGKLNLVWSGHLLSWLAYNTELINIREMDNFSYWELVNPKWMGKVLWDDPRVPGNSQAVAMFIYANPQLGPDYLKALAKNQPLLLRDKRLAHEWVARGKYPLILGGAEQQIVEFAEAGMPIKTISKSKEGASLNPGNGTVIVLDKSPNPNATKVYLNWLVSREAQIIWVKEISNPSRRVDVPNSELVEPGRLPLSDKNYIEFYTEEALKIKDSYLRKLIEIIGEQG